MKFSFLAIILVMILSSAPAQTKNFIDQPLLEVSGNADTLVIPDEIYIRIHITEKDTRDRIPVEELEQKMVTALTELGINVEKDLSTSDMISNYRFYLLKSRDILKSRQYILKVSDASSAGKVFIRLEDIGISNTSIAHVEHSAIKAIKNTMRSNAVADAKSKAVALTAPLNQKPGPAIHISDTETYASVGQGRNQLNEVVVVGYMDRNKAEDAPKISFEKIRITANISVKFILLSSDPR